MLIVLYWSKLSFHWCNEMKFKLYEFDPSKSIECSAFFNLIIANSCPAESIVDYDMINILYWTHFWLFTWELLNFGEIVIDSMIHISKYSFCKLKWFHLCRIFEAAYTRIFEKQTIIETEDKLYNTNKHTYRHMYAKLYVFVCI